MIIKSCVSLQNGDEWQASAESLLALEAEIPLLSALREFTERAARARWFAELGEPIDGETAHLARLYLDALGFPMPNRCRF